MQELLTYTLLLTAVAYVGYRIYGSIRKQKACGKCELMKVAKNASAK